MKRPAAEQGGVGKKHAAIDPAMYGKIDRTRIYAVVPARAGSKGVKGKNIKDFCGKPLMGWAIENGLKSKYVTRTFVSTDSEEYRQTALKCGAEVPFLRPAEISHDTATDYQLFDHFLRWFKENEPDAQPSLLVQLRPTAPCVTVDVVDAAIARFLEHEDKPFDSLRSVTPSDHEPFNMYFLDTSDGVGLAPLIPVSHHKDDPSQIIEEPQSVARQILPKIYWHNAYIDIIRPSCIMVNKNCMGKRCLSFHMGPEHNADIDTPEQWAAAEEKKKAQLAQASSA
mmetsp:Transcript_41639/g.107749  ORF Transcript_41639/g.107749 Transcript_41639/m.107749 type:complete len:283 (-) Transcript_41639:498-1346(-)